MKKDISNQIFGSLTVIKKLDSRQYNQYWLCQCICGNIIEKSTENLCCIRNKKHCGCQDKKLMFQSGQRFGKLIIIKETKIKYNHRNDPVRAWECLCDCGKTTIQSTYDLVKRNYSSCGCSRGLYGSELTGQKFGRLTALEVSKTKTKHNKHWECICECGKRTTVSTSALVKGITQSCGCLHKDYIEKYRLKMGQDPNISMLSRKIFLRGQILGKKKIIKEYGNKCQLCQEEYTNQSLIIHHIIPMSVDESLYKQKENLIPLCKKCHFIAHNNSWWQIDPFIQQKLSVITGLELPQIV